MSFDNTQVQLKQPATTHLVDIPSEWNIETGDLLMIFISSGTSGVYVPVVPTGWTEGFLGTNDSPEITQDINRIFCGFYKTSDGTEGGTQVSINIKESSFEEAAVVFVTHKKEWASIEFSSLNYDASTNTPQSPAITPSWGVKDGTMFISSVFQSANSTVVSFPTGYTENNIEGNQSTLTDSSFMALATKLDSVETETPPSYSTSDSSQTVGITIAIEPVANPEGVITHKGQPVEGAVVTYIQADPLNVSNVDVSGTWVKQITDATILGQSITNAQGEHEYTGESFDDTKLLGIKVHYQWWDGAKWRKYSKTEWSDLNLDLSDPTV